MRRIFQKFFRDGEKMAAKITQARTYEKKIKKAMESLGVQKPGFDIPIGILAQLLLDYQTIKTQFEEEGSQLSVRTADGGLKKNPTVAVLENLRKDILSYCDKLCITPKALKAEAEKAKEPSALEKAMSNLDG